VPAPRVAEQREPRERHSRDEALVERDALLAQRGLDGAHQHEEPDRSEAEDEAAVQVAPEHHQGWPEPRRPAFVARPQDDPDEEQRHLVRADVEKPVRGRRRGPERDARAERRSAVPPRNGEADAEHRHQQCEVRPCHELGVHLVGQPAADAPEPLVVHPRPALEGEREVIRRREAAGPPDLSTRGEMPPQVGAGHRRLEPRGRAEQRRQRCEPAIDFRHPFE